VSAETLVREALVRGASREEIERVLTRAGWSAEQVQGALAAFAPVDFPVPVPRPRPQLSARDAFLSLVLFATLYTVAINLGSLLFQLIDRALPDTAADRPWVSVGEAIRWSVASMVVALPVFLFVSSLTNREIRRNPIRRSSPVRRWLTYLTLFLASCVLIGDLVSLVYNLLGGELTARFVSKVAVVGAIAGGVFGYYLSELRTDDAEAAS
jgi:membrane protein YqaA with SNARE-associated domain